MRIIVCGGRNYRDQGWIFKTLDAFHARYQVSLLAHGDEPRGCDSLVDLWASTRGVDRVKFPANWTASGPAAGPLRNRFMLRAIEPAMVVAFPGGRGTADMLSQARAARAKGTRLDVWEVPLNDKPEARTQPSHPAGQALAKLPTDQY